jgi:hypothetical protein
MIVESTALACELRRRRVGRAALLEALDRCQRSAWVPGEVATAPTSLLVLAAMSVTRVEAERRGS